MGTSYYTLKTCSSLCSLYLTYCALIKLFPVNFRLKVDLREGGGEGWYIVARPDSSSFGLDAKNKKELMNNYWAVIIG